jgi:hypothetical protein
MSKVDQVTVRKSANTYIQVVRDGYSPKADGPKNPPKGASAAGGWSTRAVGDRKGVTKETPRSKA